MISLFDLPEILSLPFMQNALLMGVLIAIPTALLSCYLVLKGWSLMGDAISHAVLPGVVVASMLGWPLSIGAFVAGLAASLATGYLSDQGRVRRDAAMGVVFSGMFGLGLVLYAKSGSSLHLDHILFGDILGVATSDLWEAAAVALIVSAAIIARGKDLLLSSFDPALARTINISPRLLHFGLLCLLSLTIVAALQAVGVILAVAFLIAPGAVAFLIAKSFGKMIFYAVAFSLLTTLFGIVLSVLLDSAPAPTIVMVMTAIFLAAFAASLRRKTPIPVL